MTMLAWLDDNGGVGFLAHVGDIEFHADGKHKEANADLAEKLERPQGAGREDELERAGRKKAEEGRTEQNAGGHLANDKWLPAAGRRPSPPGGKRQE